MWKKIIRNALVLGGIAAVSSMISTANLSVQNIYAGVLTGILVALVEIQHAYHIIPTSSVNKKAKTTFFLS